VDENPVQAENEQVVEDNNQPTSPVDETNTSEEQPDTGQADESPSEEPREEESERKPTRAERRIRRLAEENKQLRAQPNQFAPSYAQPPQIEVQPGQELSIEDYQQHVAQAAQSVVAPQVEQLRAEFETKEAATNFNNDLALIEEKYPELQDSSPIAPVLDDAISEAYKREAYRLVGFDPRTGQPQYRIDPSVRLADIAAKEVAKARAIANASSADLKNAVARQADESAIKPSGGTGSDKPFSELSIEEMEARLGTVRL